MKTSSYILTDDEVVLLDGLTSNENVNAAIKRIKEARHLQSVSPNLNERESGLVAQILEIARNDKKVICRCLSMSHCDVCGKRAGYAKHKRTTRYHRKGDTDHSKPLYFSGYDFKDSFVTIKGHASVGCCSECFDKLKSTIADSLKNINCEVSEKITGNPKDRIKVAKHKCDKCNWIGLETDMRPLPAVFDGYYFGGCPSCSAENKPFAGHSINSTNEYEVVLVSSLSERAKKMLGV